MTYSGDMMTSLKKFFNNYRWSFLSGVLVGTSWVPFAPWALLFCYLPLWWDLRDESNWKVAFKKTWWAQFILTLIGFYWIAFVAHDFGYLPLPVAILVAILFAALMHVYLAIGAALAVFLKNKLAWSSSFSVFFMASLWALLEIVWPGIFPWNHGYPLMYFPTLWAQWADVVGMSGLSLIILWLNALLFYILVCKKSWKVKLVYGFGVLVFIATAGLVGFQKYKFHLNAEAKSEKSLNTLIVQANIGNLEKIMAEKGRGYQGAISESYFRLSKEGLRNFPDTDLVVWPESAYPDYLNPHQNYRKYHIAFKEFLTTIKTPVLTGAYSKDLPAPGKRSAEYNGLFIYDENGQLVADPYHKTYLLIFGEYIPFGDKYKWLADLNPGGVGFKRGPGPTVVDFKGKSLGLQICYESLYPEFTVTLVEKGAQVLVNLTNDSWFGPTSEPWQHMQMTLARAIEVRRPLIRSTNTGISTVVQASGQVLPLSPLFSEWYGFYQVKVPSQELSLTFYAKYGSFLPWILLCVLAAMIIFGRHRKTK